MFKTALIVSLLSSLVASVASVDCPPTDKTGSPLQGPGTDAGQGFITCTYATAGACTYFGESGEFSSGASTCPVGIAQGTGTTTSTTISTSQQQSVTTSAPVTTVSTGTTSSTTAPSSSSTTSSSSSPSSSNSTTTSDTAASTDGSVSTSSPATSTLSVTPTPAASAPSSSTSPNSAATVFKQGSISSAIGLMMIVTAMNFA